MKAGRVFRQARITRADLRNNPRTYYLFGDNMMRTGLGGQAREMRGEPNAIGIPTKWVPTMEPAAFFTDAAADNQSVRMAIIMALDEAEKRIRQGFDLCIPSDGIGTGFAELPQRAPRVHSYIERRLAEIERKARKRALKEATA